MVRAPGFTRRSYVHFAVTFGVVSAILLTMLVLAVQLGAMSGKHVSLRTAEVEATVLDMDERAERCGHVRHSLFRKSHYRAWWNVEWVHPDGEVVQGRISLCNGERYDYGEVISIWVSHEDQAAALAGERPDTSSFSMLYLYLLGIGVAAVFGGLMAAFYAWDHEIYRHRRIRQGNRTLRRRRRELIRRSRRRR